MPMGFPRNLFTAVAFLFALYFLVSVASVAAGQHIWARQPLNKEKKELGWISEYRMHTGTRIFLVSIGEHNGKVKLAISVTDISRQKFFNLFSKNGKIENTTGPEYLLFEFLKSEKILCGLPWELVDTLQKLFKLTTCLRA